MVISCFVAGSDTIKESCLNKSFTPPAQLVPCNESWADKSLQHITAYKNIAAILPVTGMYYILIGNAPLIVPTSITTTSQPVPADTATRSPPVPDGPYANS